MNNNNKKKLVIPDSSPPVPYIRKSFKIYPESIHCLHICHFGPCHMPTNSPFNNCTNHLTDLPFQLFPQHMSLHPKWSIINSSKNETYKNSVIPLHSTLQHLLSHSQQISKSQMSYKALCDLVPGYT